MIVLVNNTGNIPSYLTRRGSNTATSERIKVAYPECGQCFKYINKQTTPSPARPKRRSDPRGRTRYSYERRTAREQFENDSNLCKYSQHYHLDVLTPIELSFVIKCLLPRNNKSINLGCRQVLIQCRTPESQPRNNSVNNVLRTL